MKERDGLPLIPCPENNESCPLYPNCFEDRHHLWPRRLGETALQKKFINHPDNIVRSCRDIHRTILDLTAPNVLPPKEYMKDFLNDKG